MGQSTMKIMMVLFLTVVFFSAFMVRDGVGQQSQETVPYYLPSDFYYRDKDGSKVPLSVYPRAIVIWFQLNVGAEARQKFFEEVLPPDLVASVERMDAQLGASELKRILTTREVYVVRFWGVQKIVELLNRIVDRKDIIADAFPVLQYQGDFVFPSGVWVQFKKLKEDEKRQVLARSATIGYLAHSVVTVYPSGWPYRLEYLFRAANSGQESNVFRMSRLMAEDLRVIWALPDLVPLSSWVRTVCDLSRPSGTINDPFTLSCTIRYNERNILIDAAMLRKITGADIKPNAVMAGLFRAEPMVVTESPGEIKFRLTFRIYQPSEQLRPQGPSYGNVFEMAGIPFYFRFRSASPTLPPEKMSTPPMRIKVLGLVPRNDAGEPTVSDIFGWKRIPVPNPVLPEKPAVPSYSKTDLRYWYSYFYKKDQSWGHRMRRIGLGFLALNLGWALLVVGRITIRKVRAYKKSPYRALRHAKKDVITGLAAVPDVNILHVFRKQARLLLLWLLDMPPGKTDREVLTECPPSLNSKIQVLLSKVNSFSAASVSREGVEEITRLLRKIKWLLRLMRLKDYLRRPFRRKGEEDV